MSDALVLFGATGDLAKKKIFPAVYQIEKAGRLGVPVVGVSSSEWTDEQLRERARESIVASSNDLDETIFHELASRITYVSGDYRDGSTFEVLAEKLGACSN